MDTEEFNGDPRARLNAIGSFWKPILREMSLNLERPKTQEPQEPQEPQEKEYKNYLGENI